MADHTSKKDDDEVILVVGLLCLDIVTICKQFPKEDSDHRCIGQRWTTGGNASNNCKVLANIGAVCEWMGTVATGKSADIIRRYIEDDLEAHGIRTGHQRYHECSAPCTTIIVNEENGSRTILFDAKDLPEFTYADFNRLDLCENRYKWIHFEGRPVEAEIRQMLDHVTRHNEALANQKGRIITSVELEKKRSNLGMLYNVSDFVFVSKDYATYCGYRNKQDAVDGFSKQIRKGAAVICAWGEAGAAAKWRDGELITCAAYPPEVVVDTLGAGDTFNAAVILSLCRHGNDLRRAVDFGCQVAGAKCGMHGYDGLRELFRNMNT